MRAGELGAVEPGMTLAAIVVAYVVLRKTSQGREATAMPGV